MAGAPAFSEHEIIQSFCEAMREAGIGAPADIDADGKLHRFKGENDKKGARNSWYVLNIDERPAGAFGSWKEGGGRHTWTMQGVQPLTDEERRALVKRQEDKRLHKEAAARAVEANGAVAAKAMWDAATSAIEHPYLTRKGVTGEGLRVGVWRKEWPDATTGEMKSATFPGTLMIPMRDRHKNITSLQGIFAKPIAWGGDTRDKDFVYGGRKKGCWTTIGKPTEVGGIETVALVEGYATGASVHMATGIAVIVCFDAGNLIAVARQIREMRPAWRLVFAADNDQWTDKPVKNPGMTRDSEAAKEVGCLVIAPWFSDVTDKPTDWNDLHKLSGLDEVRRQVMGVLAPAPAESAPPPYEEIPDGPGKDDTPAPPIADTPMEWDTGGHFKIRGFDRDNIYIYSNVRKMIVSRARSDWGKAALISIAPLTWWELQFDGSTAKAMAMAHDKLVRFSDKAGFFDPSTLRGRGAWADDGRTVYHFGHKLMVNGEMMDISKIDSTYIYEQGRRMRLPAADALSTADGRKIIDVAEMFSWNRPASAILIAGWCALAPLGGALSWRPHVWITGGAGSGKSTVLSKFVDWLMNGARIYANGNSTEAGLRQELKMDALPILFDESEQNDQRERMRVQGILALFRQASTESGARTYKGTQNGTSVDYDIRSMACLSSIQVGIEQQADAERITLLALKSKRESSTAAADWKVLKAAIEDLHRDKTLPARLMRRAIDQLPLTLQNIDVFAAAAAEHFGSQREGDQYGAMLAGAWSLIRNRLATDQDARDLIGRYDWTDYTIDAETEGSDKALGALLGAKVRIDGARDVTIYELVAAAAERPEEGMDWTPKKADQALKRYGMSVAWTGPSHRGGVYLPFNAKLLVSNTSEECRKLVERTSFAADLRGQLLRVPGAKMHVSVVSFLGVKSRCVEIPMPYVLDGATLIDPATIQTIDDDDTAF
jgi:putative DNA primase/helicase